MEVYACRPGEVPPAGYTVVSEDYQLGNGESVIVYRKAANATDVNKKLSVESDRLREETESTMEECHALAMKLGLESEEQERRQVKELIANLHEYNETKDLAQALIGQIASIEGCTTRELYPRFDLALDD